MINDHGSTCLRSKLTLVQSVTSITSNLILLIVFWIRKEEKQLETRKDTSRTAPTTAKEEEDMSAIRYMHQNRLAEQMHH